MRLCNKCNKEKEISEFRVLKARGSKPTYILKGCRECETKAYCVLYYTDLAKSRKLGREAARRYLEKKGSTGEYQRIDYRKDLEKSRMLSRLYAHNRPHKYRPKNKVYTADRRVLLRKGPLLTESLYNNVFEENRKQYGVLTCWICFKPIVGESGQLEHDLCPKRGGLNVRLNLGVAHASCNRSKGVLTRVEYWSQRGGMIVSEEVKGV